MDDQNALYCAMLQLACLIDDARKERVGNLTAACERCEIGIASCGNDHYRFTGPLAKSVGINIGPFINRQDYQVHLDK